MALNLNGMDEGGDKVGRKILPLGQGERDLGLLRINHDSGYRGPIGLMCYGIPGDAREHLARSMKVWRSWHRLP